MKPGILAPALWPKHLAPYREDGTLRGIFLGGCVHRGTWSTRGHIHDAHAHPMGKHLGWVCIRKPRDVGQRTLMLHEVAHLLTGGRGGNGGHGPEFFAKLSELNGGRLPSSDANSKRYLEKYAKERRELEKRGRRMQRIWMAFGWPDGSAFIQTYGIDEAEGMARSVTEADEEHRLEVRRLAQQRRRRKLDRSEEYAARAPEMAATMRRWRKRRT